MATYQRGPFSLEYSRPYKWREWGRLACWNQQGFGHFNKRGDEMHGTHLYRVRITSYTIHPLYMTTFTIHQTYPLTHFVFHPSCLLSSCPLPFHTMHITNSCIYILSYPLYPYILPLTPLIDTYSFTKSFFNHPTHCSSPIFSPLFCWDIRNAFLISLFPYII